VSRPGPALEAPADGLGAHDAADPQARRKLARTLGHRAMEIVEAEPDLSAADIDLLLTALTAGPRAHSHPHATSPRLRGGWSFTEGAVSR